MLFRRHASFADNRLILPLALNLLGGGTYFKTLESNRLDFTLSYGMSEDYCSSFGTFRSWVSPLLELPRNFLIFSHSLAFLL